MNLNWPLECKFVICLLKKNCVSVIKIHETHDFPGGTVDKNLPANAGGTWVQYPWLGKTAHALEQLNP